MWRIATPSETGGVHPITHTLTDLSIVSRSPIGPEAKIDSIQRTGRRTVGRGSARALQAQPTHEPLHGAARHLNALPVQLLPDLVGTVDLQWAAFHRASRGLCVAQDCPAGPHGVGRPTGPATRADRLDPIGIPVLVDVVVREFGLRSSSACAKKAVAVRRTSLARRRSLFSRSSAVMRSRSLALTPSRWPLSVSMRLTNSNDVWGTQPIFGAMETAAHRRVLVPVLSYQPHCLFLDLG